MFKVLNSHLHICPICEKSIPQGKTICEDCNKQILECSWILTCDCEEDCCMALCRDCVFNGKMKGGWKDILSQLQQEAIEC